MSQKTGLQVYSRLHNYCIWPSKTAFLFPREPFCFVSRMSDDSIVAGVLLIIAY